jgi:hypothetical protein
MKIKNYSCFDNYTVKSDTENISSITDKLIRLSAKITERFAGDIIYDIEGLRRKMAEGKPYDKVLFFREDGVWVVDVEKLEDYTLDREDIQSWRLTYDPQSGETVLVRVYITKEDK